MISQHYDVFYSKYKPGNAFVVAKVEGKALSHNCVYIHPVSKRILGILSVSPLSVSEITADCYTSVAEICPFKKPFSHCPRCALTSIL